MRESEERWQRQKNELEAKYPDGNYPEQICPYCGHDCKPSYPMRLSSVEPPHHCSKCDHWFAEESLTDDDRMNILLKCIGIVEQKSLGNGFPRPGIIYDIVNKGYYATIFSRWSCISLKATSFSFSFASMAAKSIRLLR